MKFTTNTTGQIPFQPSKGIERFKKDLEKAHSIENNLKTLLEDYWKGCTITTSQGLGAFSDWDLKVQFNDGVEEDLLIEVKQDRLVHIYGNVVVELGRMDFNNKLIDTCLNATKSDVYAYFFNNTYHLVDTPRLKRLIKEKKYPIKAGGNCKLARIAVIPLKDFMTIVQIKLKPKKNNG